MLKNFSIVKKFALGFGAIFVFLFLFLFFTLYTLNTIKMVAERDVEIKRGSELAYLLNNTDLQLDVSLNQYTDIYDQSVLNDLEKGRQLRSGYIAELRKLNKIPEVDILLNNYETLIARRKILADKIISAVNQKAPLAEIITFRQEREVLTNEAGSYLKRIVEIENQELAKALENSKELRANLMRNTIVFILLVLIIIAVVSFWIIRSVTVPIGLLGLMAQQIAGGNLDAKTTIGGRNEFGTLATLFNSMTEKLRDKATELASIAKEKEDVRKKLAVTVEELAESYASLERKVEQRTAQLKASQERLDLSLDSAKMGAWDLDLIHDTAERTLKHDQIFGYTKLQEKWGAKIFGEHVIPEDRAHAQECFESAFKTGVFTMQCRIAWSDKSIHWIEALGHVYYDDNKKPVKMLGTVLDITDRKNIEFQIIEAKAKDEALLESIGDGVISTDSEGKIILMNQAAQEMLGWHLEEMVGKLLFDAVSIEDEKGNAVPREKRPMYLALAGTTTTTTTVNYKKKDGTVFPVATTVSPIMVGNELIGAVEVFRDITKEKDIDKAKTEFVSLASHQLRTPLSTVSWYAEMLLAGDAGKLKPEQKKYLDEIYTGNQRMVELVNALLNVSRLELGTFVVEPEPTDIVKLAQSVLDEQKPQIDMRKLNMKSIFAKDIPLIPADQKMLRMVFQNLLSNSVKYTPEGGNLEFEIGLQKQDIAIRVSDTGYGITKGQQDKIFSKLFRADNVKEKDTEGTGLGLYIVKSIVEHSGGTIRFESEENKGTTFYITLPLLGMEKKEGTKTLA